MKIKLTALTVKFMYGRQVVTCVPRNAETNEQLQGEMQLSQALEYLTSSKAHHTIDNAEEVLTCIVNQFGFGA